MSRPSKCAKCGWVVAAVGCIGDSLPSEEGFMIRG